MQFLRKKQDWKKSERKAKTLRKLTIKIRQLANSFLRKTKKSKLMSIPNIQEKSKNSTTLSSEFLAKSNSFSTGGPSSWLLQKETKTGRRSTKNTIEPKLKKSSRK